jgi:hypothetical protein
VVEFDGDSGVGPSYHALKSGKNRCAFDNFKARFCLPEKAASNPLFPADLNEGVVA